jgi:hypothetical protein
MPNNAGDAFKPAPEPVTPQAPEPSQPETAPVNLPEVLLTPTVQKAKRFKARQGE